MALELFDPSYYRSVNPDLGGLSNEEALQHLVTFGLVEGREFSRWVTPQMLDTYADWNCEIYPNEAAFNSPQTRLKTAFEHLRDFGLDEGRPLRVQTDLVISTKFFYPSQQRSTTDEIQVRPEYFNADYYQQRYGDLAPLSNQELFQHFINFGINEGRRGSSSFHVTAYLENSADLQQIGFTNQQAVEHFIRFGVDEGSRRSRVSFVSQVADIWQENLVYFSSFYRSHNPDLGGFDDLQLVEHFQDFGRDEGRRASPYFDVNAYLASNPDLQQAGLTNREAIAHFIAFGFKELRKATPLVDQAEALKNNLATAPSLGEVPLGFWFNDQQTRIANPARADGVLSTEDRIDYYRLEYLRNSRLEFPGLSENINVKIIHVNPDFLPDSVRQPLRFEFLWTGLDNHALTQVNQPIETTVLPPEAFAVVAELNPTDRNGLSLEVVTDQLIQQGLYSQNLVLMVEASDELTNPTPYSLIYSYPAPGGSVPWFLRAPSAPLFPDLPPECFDSPIASMTSLPLATVEAGTLSDTLWDVRHSPEGLSLLG
ncbi:hypothetical protein [Laspinema palackyanum]|uniref:hypothetical protein n=1 Tax=Laspinema palackyanum TaxID=3231601 RepID=UPI00345CB24F|nr:hypothetical protein [Laspinema sp. D2c]